MKTNLGKSTRKIAWKCALAVTACGGPANNSSLFSASGGAGYVSTTSGGSARESSGASAGSTSDSTAASSGMPASGGASNPTGGAGGSLAQGGAGGSANAGAGGELPNGGSGGSAVGGDGGTSGQCAARGPTAGYFPANQHCYLAVHDQQSFADASTHCTGLGGHLVTLSDSAENSFVWKLDANEHWIGATDGKAAATPGLTASPSRSRPGRGVSQMPR